MKEKFLLCIGHRGAMGYEPENTLRSIKKAIALGAPCIEIDVHCHGSELLVIHDDSLDRTTDGFGPLANHDLTYLRGRDAGLGQQIPLLAEVCASAYPRTCVNIELKGPGTAAPVAAFISSLVDDGWPYHALLVSSFDHVALAEMNRLNDRILLGVLWGSLPTDVSLASGGLPAFSIHVPHALIDAGFVADVHNLKRFVFAYTADEPQEIERLQLCGVDGVFTNFPDRVVDYYAQGADVANWNERICST